jgi:hypothetical protein
MDYVNYVASSTRVGALILKIIAESLSVCALCLLPAGRHRLEAKTKTKQKN